MGLGALVVASPLILFTRDCLSGTFQSQWNPVDRFYHSWTPFNFLTLLYPWFFGKSQYDRMEIDYWWQYQFVEMQVAFSIVGLFFIVLFFLGKNPNRKWVAGTSLFSLLMAFGKFSPLYPLIQSLPVFSFFRDPSRYWFLATWVLGLGAAWAWEDWFKESYSHQVVKRWLLTLVTLGLLVPALGWFVLTPGRPLLENLSAWGIQHFLLKDSLHLQDLSFYIHRLPEKFGALAYNTDLSHPRVFLPLLFLAGLFGVVLNHRRWNLSLQKILLLGLVLADLYAFRMPLGMAFYSPSGISSPRVPAPVNRSLTLLYETPSPFPINMEKWPTPT